MAGKIITPSLGDKSFSCPHCEAVSHQTWYKVYLDDYSKDQYPWMPGSEILDDIDKDVGDEARAGTREYFTKRLARKPFEERNEQAVYLRNQLDNVFAGQCYSCDAWSIWVADELIYHNQKYTVLPTAEMPDDVKTDFLEAAAIVDVSARGAAALLRLCIQKIVMALGEKGENLNNDIGLLVEKRKITAEIQKALDVVRVVGNNAVHPGVIDFKDNKTIAIQLFSLVNVIVESTIAAPKHIKNIYESVVPETARTAIEKRDAPKS
jgi:hypothetical protein